MVSVDEFLQKVRGVIAAQQQGNLTITEANRAIGRLYSPIIRGDEFDAPVHPMVHKIADLTFNIVEDYRTELSDKEDWELLVKTYNDYIQGIWEQTCWMLAATYGEAKDGKLIQPFSLSITR